MKAISVTSHGPSIELTSSRKTENLLKNLRSDSPPGNLQFRVFAILWAIATLFHMAHSSIFNTQLNLALLTLAAFFVIFRPSLAGFISLIILQLFDAFFRMPFTTNHWIFTAFVNATVLHVLLFLMIRNRSFKVAEGQFFKSFAPVIRLEVIILYFFAVFHKLNSGFFTPTTSCATDLLKAQHIDQVIPLNEEIFAINAWFTLIVEISIPVLLCFRQTRNAGVLIGLIFHCILSYSTYNAFYDFSAMMFAAYFVFLNPAFSIKLSRVRQRLASAQKSLINRFSIPKLLYVIFFTLACLGAIYILNKGMDTSKTVHLYFFWTVYSILFATCFINYVLFGRAIKDNADRRFGMLHWSFMIMPVVVFVNGTLPYIGLKTENSYAMFSNLRTEGGRTNHFIVPARIQVFDFQQDVVEIVYSTDHGLQKLANENKAMVLFEFRNYVNDRKPDTVEYVLNGDNHIFLNGESTSAKTLGKNPYVLKKLMKFRPFTLEEPQPCAH